MAELHGLGLAAVFAADADLQVRTRLASLCSGHLHQLADAILIESGERILLEDPAFRYAGRNLLMSSREMPKVVCVRSLVPKLKNSASFRDLIGHQRSARQFDHGADHVLDLRRPFP